MGSDRADALAAELDRIAAELRTGTATLYGYDVEAEPTERERGGVDYSGGWLSFEIDHPDGWFGLDAED